MQPTGILITAMTVATALAAGARFDELTYGVCQAICTRQALTCYDDAGVTVGSKNAYGSAANVTACNVTLDTCGLVCAMVASGGCDSSECC
ncbi:hypothetical protein KVR01_013659 [Diaporthe batatas]|uniref:uncharacterized protein n=1 Tax=Diaporthe batatas TaxID=748121 RepID=UPI001D038F51|nr:uncharacterized protein KVR01_013659 [Diaporthe batatas]KAG8156555.1 hypothetical protein KVR01_013659 [Diaporthe batatas]